MIGQLLNKLEKNRPNVYTVLMMFFFVAFFDAVSRILHYFLPSTNTFESLIVAIGMGVVSIYVFMSQDNDLSELALNHKKMEQKSGVAAVISAVHMGN